MGTVFDVAERYAAQGIPTVVIAGSAMGWTSLRDWAAKAQHLLGVRAVLAASFERIHRTNLVGMGILPLVLPAEVRAGLGEIAPTDRFEVDVDAEALVVCAVVGSVGWRQSAGWTTSSCAPHSRRRRRSAYSAPGEPSR